MLDTVRIGLAFARALHGFLSINKTDERFYSSLFKGGTVGFVYLHQAVRVSEPSPKHAILSFVLGRPKSVASLDSGYNIMKVNIM
jgi:hypothetical protein